METKFLLDNVIVKNMKSILFTVLCLVIGYLVKDFEVRLSDEESVYKKPIHHNIESTEISVTPRGDLFFINREDMSVISVVDSTLVSEITLYLQLHQFKSN